MKTKHQCPYCKAEFTNDDLDGYMQAFHDFATAYGLRPYFEEGTIAAFSDKCPDTGRVTHYLWLKDEGVYLASAMSLLGKTRTHIWIKSKLDLMIQSRESVLEQLESDYRDLEVAAKVLQETKDKLSRRYRE